MPDKLKYKILYLITSWEIGGAETALLKFIKRLIETGFSSENIMVIALSPNGSLREKFRELNIQTFSLGLMSPYELYKALKLKTYINDFKPDILHTHLLKADLVGAVIGRICQVKKIVSTKHNGNQLLNRAKKILEKGIESFIDLHISVSDAVKTDMVKRGIPEQKIKTIPISTINPLNKNLIAPILSENKTFTIGVLSRLHPVKSFEDIVLMTQYLLQRKYSVSVIIGGEFNNEYGRRISRMIDAFGLLDVITMLGTIDDLTSFFSRIDVLVSASISEGFPQSLIEAMVYSLPVVATAVGGVPELVIDGQTGFLVPPRCPELLADKVEFLIKNPEIRTRMGIAGEMRVRDHFTLDAMIEKTLILYDRLMG